MAERLKLLPPEVLEEATVEEKELYVKLLERERSLRSPLDFAERASPGTIRYRHIEYLNDWITALCEYRLYRDGPGPVAVFRGRVTAADGEQYEIDIPDPGDLHGLTLTLPEGDELVQVMGHHPERGDRVMMRLAISMPPRHGKSYLVTEHLPAWFVSTRPDAKVALATYSDEFAKRWGRKVRDLLVRTDYAEVRGGRSGARGLIEFEDRSAEMMFVGTGGALTGSGFVLGIIDDPFKNSEEAMSEQTRQSRKDWYESTFITRKEKHTALEIMMFTRWHEDDLFGEYVLDEDGELREDWVYIHLPALAEEDDVLGRAYGAALCPAIKTQSELEDQRRKTPQWFEAMYQGNPSIEAGGVFSRPFYYYRRVVDDADGTVYVAGLKDGGELRVSADTCVQYATVDTAATEKTSSDWTVMSIWDWSRMHQKLFLVAQRRERVAATLLRETVMGWADEFPRLRWIGVEERTYGLQLIQDMVRMGGITVRPLAADRDKVARAIPFGQACANGQVFFPTGASWLGTLESELLVFYNGRYDDQVDAGAYGWLEALKMPRVRGENKPKGGLTMQQMVRERIQKQILAGKRRGSSGALAKMLR